MNLINAIELIVELERDYAKKLEMLTSIGVTSSNEETFESCEEIRDRLSESHKEGKNQGQDLLHSEDWKRFGGDHWGEEPDELLQNEEALSML